VHPLHKQALDDILGDIGDPRERQRITGVFSAAAASPGTAVYLRHERQEGWSGYLPIYVLCCLVCKRTTSTYPSHSASRPRIVCGSCRHYVHLEKEEQLSLVMLRAGFWAVTAASVLILLMKCSGC
jgi:hypothetical protein